MAVRAVGLPSWQLAGLGGWAAGLAAVPILHVLMHDVLALLVELDHKEHEDDLHRGDDDTVSHHRRCVFVDGDDGVAKDGIVDTVEDVANVIDKDREELLGGVVVVTRAVKHRRHEVTTNPGKVEEDATKDHQVVQDHEQLKRTLDDKNRPVGKALEVVVPARKRCEHRA